SPVAQSPECAAPDGQIHNATGADCPRAGAYWRMHSCNVSNPDGRSLSTEKTAGQGLPAPESDPLRLSPARPAFFASAHGLVGKPVRTFPDHALKPLRRLDTQQREACALEIREMRLPLRQRCMHVAKAALERAALEDRGRAGRAVTEVDHRGRLLHRGRDRDAQLGT